MPRYSNHQTETSDDEMYVSRPVGVRRTQRKKIIASVVVLAFVIGLWQYFRENSDVIWVEEHNVRVGMRSGDFKTLLGKTIGRKIIVQVTSELSESPDSDAAKVGADIASDTNRNDYLIPLVGKVGDSGGIVNNEYDLSAHQKVNSSLYRNERLSQNVSGSALNVSDNVTESRTSRLNVSSNGITQEPNKRNVTVRGESKAGLMAETNDHEPMVETSDHGRTANSSETKNYTIPRFSTTKEGQFQFLRIANSSTVPSSPHPERLNNSPFRRTDIARLKLLSEGLFREIYSVKNHEIRLVAFDVSMSLPPVIPIESCPVCATIKNQKHIHEVLAFHVDRTLGVERALPVSARKFQSSEREDLGLTQDLLDSPFPVMWFANDLIHQGHFQPDQNSVQLNWRQYQKILRNCQSPKTTDVQCTDIEYSDWSRMAVLDFVMQNNDRLDRYCCGYDEELAQSCYRNGARSEIRDCDDIDNRYLVHILTSESNPRHLVLLDNTGKLHARANQLNYEILKGIRTIPQKILQSINSADFGARLKSSLGWDVVYTEAIGEENLVAVVNIITERVDRLRLYIEENNITEPTTDSSEQN